MPANHCLYCLGFTAPDQASQSLLSGQNSHRWNWWMDYEIAVPDCLHILVGINLIGKAASGAKASLSGDRRPPPHIRADHIPTAVLSTDFCRQHASPSTICIKTIFYLHSSKKPWHGTACRYRGRQFA